jgi:hypothetical protein
MSVQVGASTPIEFGRFIHTKEGRLSQRADGSWRVKERAFLPAENHSIVPPRLEASVFRIEGLSDQEVWELAVEQLEQAAGLPPVKAAGVVTPRAVADVGLQVDYDNDPPRHAAIIGWSDKPTNKMKAQALAETASALIRPGSGL